MGIICERCGKAKFETYSWSSHPKIARQLQEAEERVHREAVTAGLECSCADEHEREDCD
jgi:hypothetical protein